MTQPLGTVDTPVFALVDGEYIEIGTLTSEIVIDESDR